MILRFSSILHGAVLFGTSVLAGLPPSAPEGLRAWPLSSTEIQLEWRDEADNETSFEVYRRLGKSGPWTAIALGLAPGSIRFTDAGLDPDSLYQYFVLSRNSDGAAYSNAAQGVTDDQPHGIRSLSFQDGIGSFAGTVDLGIQEADPSVSNTGTYLWVDNNGVDGDNQALLRFDGIFGNMPDQVPPDARITRAVLNLYLGTNENAQTYKPICFHQMLVAWDRGYSWSSSGWGSNGIQPDDIEARLAYDSFGIFPNPGDYYEVDVTPSVKAWASGADSHGWLLRTAWGDGYAFYTSLNPVVLQRPELIVSFDTEPENMAPSVSDPYPAPGSSAVHEPAEFQFQVSDANADPMTVTVFGRKAPYSPHPDFRVILLPDTQFYCARLNGATPYMFYRQVEWTVENHEALNIPFVLHLGDMVHNGDIKGGVDNIQEWLVAAQALYRMHSPVTTGLAEGLPFAVNVGNHDQQPRWRASGETRNFNKYFGVDHFSRFSYYGGNFGQNNDNHYYLFKAGGFDFIVVSLEYCDPALDPVDPDLLEWVDALLKEHPDHRGILVSHHMINPGNPGTWSPYGEILYEVLKDNPNLHLMLGGHVTGEGLRVNTHEGNTVYALVQDYQGLPLGGGGFLRILTFSPEQNEIQLQTYSPWLDQYLDDFGGAFSLPYDLGTKIDEFSEIKKTEYVMTGQTHAFTWYGLEPQTDYEWYSYVSDGRKSFTSEVNRFRTALRTYSTWADQYFENGHLDAEPDRDPDLDGYSNQMEFVFNGDPTEAEPLQTRIRASVSSDGKSHLHYYRFSFPGLMWAYEVSNDLTSWTNAEQMGISLEELVEDQGNGMEQVTINIESSPSAVPLFWRICSHLSTD